MLTPLRAASAAHRCTSPRHTGRLLLIVLATILFALACTEDPSSDPASDADASRLDTVDPETAPPPRAAEPDTVTARFEAALDDSLFVPPTTRIASGFWHTCALDAAGRASCWGRSEAPYHIEVADSALLHAGQADAPAETRFRALAAGAFHTCGLRADDDLVECWGDDRHGESSPPASRFRQIDAGLALSCGVRADGSLLCWGRHADTLTLPAGQDFVQVVVGKTWLDYPHNDVCALRQSGRVECVTTLEPAFESRRGPFVQVGLSSAALCGVHLDGRIECWRCPALQCIDRDVGQASPPAGRFSSLSANNVHACAVGERGIECWGQADERLEAPPVDFVEVSAGWFHTCGLDAAGAVHCWGSDRGGQAQPPL